MCSLAQFLIFKQTQAVSASPMQEGQLRRPAVKMSSRARRILMSSWKPAAISASDAASAGDPQASPAPHIEKSTPPMPRPAGLSRSRLTGTTPGHGSRADSILFGSGTVLCQLALGWFCPGAELARPVVLSRQSKTCCGTTAVSAGLLTPAGGQIVSWFQAGSCPVRYGQSGEGEPPQRRQGRSRGCVPGSGGAAPT